MGLETQSKQEMLLHVSAQTRRRLGLGATDDWDKLTDVERFKKSLDNVSAATGEGQISFLLKRLGDLNIHKKISDEEYKELEAALWDKTKPKEPDERTPPFSSPFDTNAFGTCENLMQTIDRLTGRD